MGNSRVRVRSFSRAARQQIGFQLELVQNGMDPSDWKPMASIGPGVREIRVHADGEHRVIYVAKFRRAIYVLHAFAKKTRQTPESDVALARERYREVLRLERLTK